MRHSLPVLATTVFGAVSLLASSSVLFPVPLHLTRRIMDPVSGSTTIVDQYCYANRVVTVSGDRTSISDHTKREFTTIDRAHGLYSITPFRELANATAPHPKRSQDDRWSTRATPGHSVLPREAYVFERAEGPVRRIEVTFDRSVLLSRDAYDVVTGATYPGNPSEAHEDVANAARSPRAQIPAVAQESYALPVGRVDTFVIDGEEFDVRDEITRIGAELPPADSLEIPAKARRVELPAVALEKLSRDLDSLPASRR